MLRRPSLSALILLVAMTGLPLGARADEASQPWIRGIFTGKSPRAVAIGERDAWQLAANLAEQNPGSFVLIGGGESMLPLYAPGTILVMQRRDYAQLQRGETALYRTRENRTVAHVLIAKARDGWRAAGLNNRLHDMEPVVEANLIGVVIAAFSPQDSRTRTLVATRN